jgi:hypothetical protein
MLLKEFGFASVDQNLAFFRWHLVQVYRMKACPLGSDRDG